MDSHFMNFIQACGRFGVEEGDFGAGNVVLKCLFMWLSEFFVLPISSDKVLSGQPIECLSSNSCAVVVKCFCFVHV